MTKKLSLLFLFLAMASPAHAVLIDAFTASNGTSCDALFASTGQCVVSPATSGTPSNSVEIHLPGVLGHTRAMSLLRLAGRLYAFAGVNVDDGGGLTYDNDAGVGSRLTLTWDGDANVGNLGNGLGNGLGVDLTDGGKATHFRLHFLALDIPIMVTVRLRDADGTLASNAFEIPVPASDVLLPFQAFVAVSNNAIALHRITGIRLVFSSPNGPGVYTVDLAVTCFDTVSRPAPSGCGE